MRIVIRLCTALVALAVLNFSTSTSRAQVSPKCQKNGKWAFCAVTSQSKADDYLIEESIAFADGSIYDVSRKGMNGCNHNGRITTCNAKIIDRGNGWKSMPAYYKGTYYEGGYKNEYIGEGLNLTYFYMD